VEKQDRFEEFEKTQPDWATRTGARFHDFNKRAAAIREVFEECNVLLASASETAQLKTAPTLSTYLSSF
jgi:8-oxo-dGTP pyrophosphatase MutT (NUDIX family)